MDASVVAVVDAVFSGHNHIYERYLYNGIHYLVTGGGGAHLGNLPPTIHGLQRGV
jgi:hypothetical protein